MQLKSPIKFFKWGGKTVIPKDLLINKPASPEIRKIAEEEESRFLAGVISAEECADIVQSRVSIYLAERS